MTEERTGQMRRVLNGYSALALRTIADANDEAVAACDRGDDAWLKSRDDMAEIAGVARELLAEREQSGVKRLVLARSYGSWLPARPALSGRAAR